MGKVIFESTPTVIEVEVVVMVSLGFDKKLVPLRTFIKYRDLSS